MLKIRNMVPNDINSAIKLTETVGWDFIEEDFKFMLDLEPEGCFIATSGQRFVGLTTTVVFGKLGWIGNVVVEISHRRKGIGLLLMRSAMDYLEKTGVKTIGLYSYLHSIPFYEHLGFKTDIHLTYLVGPGVKRNSIKEVKPMEDEDFKAALQLDRKCIGYSREKVLTSIFKRSRNLCYVVYKGDNLAGYVMGGTSNKIAEIGPLICKSSFHFETAALLNALLRKFVGLKVHIGVPENKQMIISNLRALGFCDKHNVVRMYCGNPLEDKGCIFAIESLERG